VTRDDCLPLGAADPLEALRGPFDLPPKMIYLDGNSLDALPRRTSARLQQAVREEWGRGLIQIWSSAGWLAETALAPFAAFRSAIT
jgi:kynureninase